jgi:hypothetical protein
MKNVVALLVAFVIVSTLQIVRAGEKELITEKLDNSNLGKEIIDQDIFSPEEMQSNWKKFMDDKSWKALFDDVEAKTPFKRINHEKAAWGFKGIMVDEKGKKHQVMFCAYDFYNPKEKSGQGCSMIWKKVDDDVYKAYIVFPAGEKNMDKALAESKEWFADRDGKVQRAHSWGKCFRECTQQGKHSVSVGDIKIKANCANSCLAAVAVCGGVTAALSIATGGFGVPVTVAIFAGCAGVACGQCVAICALGCQ